MAGPIADSTTLAYWPVSGVTLERSSITVPAGKYPARMVLAVLSRPNIASSSLVAGWIAHATPVTAEPATVVGSPVAVLFPAV